MTTIIINEKTKIGKSVLEMLKVLAQAEQKQSIKFPDETQFLLSTEANRKALLHGISQVNEGKRGKTIKTSDLWK